MRVPGAPIVTVDGETMALPTAHLLSEHIGQYMPLPDVRELRSRHLEDLADAGQGQGAARAADALVTVLGRHREQRLQGRRAGALRLPDPGHRRGADPHGCLRACSAPSPTRCPTSPWPRARAGQGRSHGRPVHRVDRPGRRAVAGSAGMFGAAGKVKVPGKFAVGRADPDFARALIDNLSEFHNDAVARRVATGGVLDGDASPPNPCPAWTASRTGSSTAAGKQLRLLAVHGRGQQGRVRRAARKSSARKSRPELTRCNTADGYIDSHGGAAEGRDRRRTRGCMEAIAERHHRRRAR